MPVTQFGIVYSTGNMHIRRWLFLDDDSEYQKNWTLPGEALQLMPAGGSYANASQMGQALGASATAQASSFVAQQTAAFAAAVGKPVGDPYCPVVNTLGKVVAVIMADPALDTYHDDPTAQLIPDPTHTVGIGWTWTQLGGFVPPVVVVTPPAVPTL